MSQLHRAEVRSVRAGHFWFDQDRSMYAERHRAGRRLSRAIVAEEVDAMTAADEEDAAAFCPACGGPCEGA